MFTALAGSFLHSYGYGRALIADRRDRGGMVNGRGKRQ
jgi:hypothetical protein